MNTRLIAALGLCVLFAPGASCGAQDVPCLSPEEQAQSFVLLFNGRDATGWRMRGPEWTVQDGALVGPSHAHGGIFTAETYGDMILRLEYWVDRGETHESNSGIFFRGRECQISLQDPRNPTGSIYGLVPTDLEQMREIAPEKQWNRVEIDVRGTRVRVTINDQPVQDCDIPLRDRGPIGFQQHHPGVTIKYRNIRLKALTEEDREPGWRDLFNGRDLEGWQPRGDATWEVKDGAIVGSGGTGHLFTKESFKDLGLRAMCRISPGGNAGIKVRVQEPYDAKWPKGYEAQIQNHGSRGFTGSLYGYVSGKRLITRDEAWFALRIRAEGDHIRIWVNGQLQVDTHDDALTEGPICLQCHDAGVTVQYRDLKVRVLGVKE